jgi:hypothetical protein
VRLEAREKLREMLWRSRLPTLSRGEEGENENLWRCARLRLRADPQRSSPRARRAQRLRACRGARRQRARVGPAISGRAAIGRRWEARGGLPTLPRCAPEPLRLAYKARTQASSTTGIPPKPEAVIARLSASSVFNDPGPGAQHLRHGSGTPVRRPPPFVPGFVATPVSRVRATRLAV